MEPLVIQDTVEEVAEITSSSSKGVRMRLKTILFSIVILTALFLSAFGSPAAPQTVKLQETVVPDVTLVPPTVIVQTTPGVPVTGGDAPTGLWTIILFGLLALLGIAFLVALFSPRTTHEHIDRNPPPPEV
jgi:hypothetical protein